MCSSNDTLLTWGSASEQLPKGFLSAARVLLCRTQSTDKHNVCFNNVVLRAFCHRFPARDTLLRRFNHFDAPGLWLDERDHKQYLVKDDMLTVIKRAATSNLGGCGNAVELGLSLLVCAKVHLIKIKDRMLHAQTAYETPVL